MKRIAVAAVLLASLTGCETRGSDAEAGASPGAWRVDSVPAVDIPGSSPAGTSLYTAATAATRLSSGTIVVADPLDATLRVFDASGRPLRSIGRRGGGPEEFGAVTWLAQCGRDSIFVRDYAHGRISVLDSAGRFVRQYPDARDALTLACSRAGLVASLATPQVSGPPSARGETYHVPLTLANTRGDSLAGVAAVKAGENRPLGRMTRLAVSGDRVFVGTADSGVVDLYASDGRRIGGLPVGGERRQPTRRHYEQAIELQVAALPDRASQEAAKRMLLGIPMPEYLPHYTGLFTDPAGTLWVQLSAPGDGATWLRAVGPAGAVLADVHLPVELTVFEVGDDYILGRYDDGSGEQHVALYRLHRGK